MVNRALAALTAVSLLGACQAETTARIFQWAFQSNSVSSTLGSCQELGIMVTPWPNYSGNSSGVPPYYMRAWEQGGSVRTTLLGSDEDDLKWIVNNPVGSKLLLNVIDSNDSSGGVAPKLFTIETGSTTNCVLDGSDTNFKVSSNVSSSEILQACQPWGLRIDGGVPPYNVSFAQVNSPVITNVTTNQDDDAYTYINRADGNKLMMASVVDSTGRIAYGTPSILTADQTDIDCGTLISTSGNSTELDAAAAAERAARGKSNRTGIIVGVVLGVLALLLLAGGGFWWWYRRRRQTQNNSEIDPDMMPTPYMSGQVLSINAFTSQQPSVPYSPKSPYGHNTDSTTHFDPYQMVNNNHPPSSSGRPTSSQSQAPSQSSISERPATFSNFPLVPVRRSKAAEAGVPGGSTEDSESSGSGRAPMERSQSTSLSAYPSVSSHHHDTRPISVSTRASFAPTGEREIIYQHRDGGVVRELPPPYADRARLGLAEGDS